MWIPIKKQSIPCGPQSCSDSYSLQRGKEGFMHLTSWVHTHSLSSLPLSPSLPLMLSLSLSLVEHTCPPPLHLFHLSCCYPLPILCFFSQWSMVPMFTLSRPCRNHPRFLVKLGEEFESSVSLIYATWVLLASLCWDGEAAPYVFCGIMPRSVSVVNIICHPILPPFLNNTCCLTHTEDWGSIESPLCLWGKLVSLKYIPEMNKMKK